MILLSVYYTDKPGGFCKRLYRLLNAAAKAGHTVHYCALDLPPEHVRTAITFHKIPFWTTQRSGLFFWGTFLLWCPIYLTLVSKEVKPNRYVVFGAFYSAMCNIARIFHQAPLSLFLRSLVFEIDRITGKPAPIRFLNGLIEKHGMRSASKIICMTESMRRAIQAFVGTGLPPVSILRNDLPSASSESLEIRELLPMRYQSVALTSGVLDQRKNISALLKGWKVASTNGATKDWALVIAGKGGLETELTRQVKELQLSNVFFIGWTPNLERYLRSVQLVIHPSLHEGISNSVLEALAHEVPVLLSDIPEHSELFPEMVSRCPAEGWGSTLESLLSSPEKIAKLRSASQNVAKELSFNWNSEAVVAATT